jgi:2-amino-4-hydroxy-6-hydroxymethyldihydropteridine diphosphokinase
VSRAVLSMGSNLGDRRAHLGQAVAALVKQVDVLAVSSIYQTPPWGPVPQEAYYNLTLIAASAELDAYGWLSVCRELEQSAGRVRDIRWGPRTLDADVVVVDDIESPDPDLTLPHPRAFARAFVLLPWAEIEPTAVLPGYGPISELLAGLDVSGIKMVAHVD